MMDVNQALQGALRPHSGVTQPAPGPALVLGAGGWLGAALLAQVLAAGHGPVGVWVRQPMASTHRGLLSLTEQTLAAPTPADRLRWQGGTAVVVLERAGLVGARDGAFLAPEVADLKVLAAQLLDLGVTRLVVVVPHAAASLPAALRQGLAHPDEAALVAMGFKQVLLVRSSRDALDVPAGTPWWERVAAWWWAQLRWMVPSDERPLRSVALARVVVRAARLLGEAPQGVWVLPQDVASRAAHAPAGLDSVLRPWLGRASKTDGFVVQRPG